MNKITLPGIPSPRKHTNKPVLAPAVWNELHDYLTLALDALGARPEDFNEAFLRNTVLHQRLALRITHGALHRIEGAA